MREEAERETACKDFLVFMFSSQKCKSVLHVIWGAYHLTEKSGWGVESIMVSDLPVYRRNAISVTV